MYLNSIFKGCLLVLKDFDQSQEWKTIAKKSLQFYMFRPHIGFLCYLDSDENLL